MKKYVLLIISCCIISCETTPSKNDNISEVEETVFTKQEKLVTLYNEKVIPLYSHFKETTIPVAFKVDKNDLGINAGAAFEYIEISKGLLNVKKEAIQLFVLCHEVSHIVTLPQAKLFSLKDSNIPKGSITNDYIKAEYLADLIAIHLIKTNLQKEFELLKQDFDYLQNLLGTSTFTHPSGIYRINSINEYLNESKEIGEEVAFKTRFIEVWNQE